MLLNLFIRGASFSGVCFLVAKKLYLIVCTLFNLKSILDGYD